MDGSLWDADFGVLSFSFGFEEVGVEDGSVLIVPEDVGGMVGREDFEAGDKGAWEGGSSIGSDLGLSCKSPEGCSSECDHQIRVRAFKFIPQPGHISVLNRVDVPSGPARGV